MTARWERRAVRLAWGTGLCSLGLVIASLVLLVLDWKAIDTPATAQLSNFLSAPIVGILGVLVAVRRPRNPIGWLLLAIALAVAITLAADFVAIRGLLSGASIRGWVEWPAWLSTNPQTLAFVSLALVLLFFPNGRLLPGDAGGGPHGWCSPLSPWGRGVDDRFGADSIVSTASQCS